MLPGLALLLNEVTHDAPSIWLWGDDAEKAPVIASGSEPDGIRQVIRRQVRIAQGHGRGGVAQDLLQGQDFPAIHHEPTGEGVP